MIDLHSHILPGLDDGANTIDVSIEMARRYLDQGVTCVACTPHIFPGLYLNNGDIIRRAALKLQEQLDEKGIPLTLVCGADNHIVPDFVRLLKTDQLLSLAETRYVLVEPPHHVAPVRLEALFFEILQGGYVPILTHPERLAWIERDYAQIITLSERGVLMQLTSGSLLGRFGKRPRYWAEKMLCEGNAHVLATDAHDNVRRPPDLLEGRDAELEAQQGALAAGSTQSSASVEEPQSLAASPTTGDAGAVEAVQRGTGSLPTFATEVASIGAPGSAGYKIGPQDVIDISVFKVPELSKSVQVSEAGTVNLPLLGEVYAASKTARDLEKDLTSQLGKKYLQNPQVSVFVKEYNSQRITVDGAVRRPGVFPLQGGVSLLQAVALAQGLEEVSDDTVLVFRERNGTRQAARFDVSDIRSGDAEDPQLIAGDVIIAGTSNFKKGFNSFLRALPIAGLFAVL